LFVFKRKETFKQFSKWRSEICSPAKRERLKRTFSLNIVRGDL
jgi:hypothetical protein